VPRHTQRHDEIAHDGHDGRPGMWTTIGARESMDWLDARGLIVVQGKRWFVEIGLDVVDRPASLTYSGDTDTRFHLNVYPEEWSVFFCHGSRASWVRVTDEAFVHGRDEHHLLGELSSIARVEDLLETLEKRYHLEFRRDRALIRSNVVGAKAAVRDWLSTL
jgi:hypothetical protein